MEQRPNARLFGGSMFKFNDIQTGRQLVDDEVIRINHIMKSRAHRYVAAFDKDWLYPERQTRLPRWDRLTADHLLMPDPRSVSFASEFIVGYKDRPPLVMDEYGRRPVDPAYRDGPARDRERDALHAFQGEYARMHGPTRRGKSASFRGDRDVDDPESHQYHLSLERLKPKRRKRSRGRR